MSNIDMVVYASTTLNTGHVWGVGKETIVLPVTTRDEESEPTTQESMFNFVRLSSGGVRRHEKLKSEVQIIVEIAKRVFGDSGLYKWDDLKNHDSIRTLISRIVPGFESFESIDKTKKEFQIPGRVLHKPVFPTDSGKARFIYHSIPKKKPLEKNEFQLLSVRSEGQFNTVVYENKDLYRDQERRDVVLMNEKDMANMALIKNSPVVVKSKTGALQNILVRPFDIKEGEIFGIAGVAGNGQSELMNLLTGEEIDGVSGKLDFNKIDIFVNNAGITGPNIETWDYEIDDWKKVIDLDLNGVFYCCKYIVPHMIQNNYGRLVNIASIAGKEGNPNAVAYSSAKSGVIALTKSLGKELADYNIAVNCVTPSAGKTRIFDQMTEEHINYMLSKIPRNKFAKVEELASLVAWMSSDENSYTTAGVFDLSGGRATY